MMRSLWRFLSRAWCRHHRCKLIPRRDRYKGITVDDPDPLVREAVKHAWVDVPLYKCMRCGQILDEADIFLVRGSESRVIEGIEEGSSEDLG